MQKMRKVKQYFEIPKYNGPGVYMIQNVDNGMCYIGSSVNINDRLRTHNYSLNGLWCSRRIQKDIELGHKFRAEILEVLPPNVSEEVLRKREKKHMGTIKPELLYNDPIHRPTLTKRFKETYTINLTVPKGKKDSIQAHAELKGESVNGFINRAIDETMEREQPPKWKHPAKRGAVITSNPIDFCQIFSLEAVDKSSVVAYNNDMIQTSPRLSTMRTMAGSFLLGVILWKN